MTDTPPPMPPRTLPATAPVGKLRLVAILVMIVSILGLIGTGFCAIGVLADGFLGSPAELLWIVLFAAPPILFFIGCIWVCSELLKRVRR